MCGGDLSLTLRNLLLAVMKTRNLHEASHTMFFKKIHGLLAVTLLGVAGLHAAANAADALEKSPATPPSDPQSLLHAAGLSPQWDLGPVSIGGRYDSTLGAIAEARYSRLINK